ncbi:MAG TPA: VWA domain-containing protein [Thermoanaerobaculia bacterium]|jgi:VWFA-related protein|nr:VWA domain-containing protein [Thermoanaerobaculia bacterium]
MSARAFVLLAVLTCPLFAQQSAPASGETIEVSIINVDVVVTDRKGNRVYGLTRDDFAIRENGVPQTITNFAGYAPQAKHADGTVAVDRSSASPEPVAAPTAKRTIVLFIEIAPQPSERIREVFSSLRDFVRKAVRPGDSATVVVFEERMTTRQTFTGDTDELAAALTAIEGESIEVALRRGDEVRRGLASDIAMDASLASASKSVRQGLNVGEHERRSEELFELIELRTKAAALTSVMESMSGVEGKKIMVAALDRFGLRLGLPQGSGPISSDPQVEAVRQTVMRSANANGVTLYPIYVPGLQYTNAPDVLDAPGIGMDSSVAEGRAGENNAMLMNQTASLFQIAEETGGLMAAGPSDIVDLLPHIVDDLESYYSLAYRASGADGARKVRVTTKNGNYEVRSRRAVLEKSDDTQMNDRVVSNLFQLIENSVIPIEADLGQITRKAKNLWSVPVSVRIPIGALTTNMESEAATGSFSVFIGSGSDLGVISDVTQRSQSYSIGHDKLEAARESHFTYDVTVDVDTRASVISVGVRDDVSKEFGMVRIPLPPHEGKANPATP